MGKKLSKAPVCFTLAQIQFEPAQDWSADVASLRDGFLEQGYSEHERIEETVVDLQDGPNGVTADRRTVIRHWFSNRLRTNGLVLDPAAITYCTTDYPIFEEYAGDFEKAIRIMVGHASIEHVVRVGIRMLDAIQPEGEDKLDQYISAATRAFGDAFGLETPAAQSSSEAIFQIDRATLVVRTHRTEHGVAMPSDLDQLGQRLNLADRFSLSARPTLMLDTDAFTFERLPFDFARIRGELDRLKKTLTRSFKAIATPYALDVWK